MRLVWSEDGSYWKKQRRTTLTSTATIAARTPLFGFPVIAQIMVFAELATEAQNLRYEVNAQKSSVM